jgi:hypothetical protein
MEPGMKNHGMACAAEFLDDRMLYRGLQPVQSDLPGLVECLDALNLPAARVPRKHETDYARVVAYILQTAQHQRSSEPIQSLIYVGDTELLDCTAFANLCQVTGWTGMAFIGDETAEPAQTRMQRSQSGTLVLANRWAALDEFNRYCTRQGCPAGPQTAVVIDLDKTILGARRRNASTIDRARSAAMQQTLAQILAADFDSAAFQQVYRTFSQVAFHPFTSDNQDYLAYVCLLLLGGWMPAAELENAVHQGTLQTFTQFIHQVEQQKKRLPPRLADTHAQVFACVQAGDPTPFKAFRRCEYTVTAAAMGHLSKDTPLDVLLAEEITLTNEVRQAALEWRGRGALLFGLSDKPDEASIPGHGLTAQGYQPLHRTPTHAVG